MGIQKHKFYTTQNRGETN